MARTVTILVCGRPKVGDSLSFVDHRGVRKITTLYGTPYRDFEKVAGEHASVLDSKLSIAFNQGQNTGPIDIGSLFTLYYKPRGLRRRIPFYTGTIRHKTVKPTH